TPCPSHIKGNRTVLHPVVTEPSTTEGNGGCGIVIAL
ncbi:hypothetical protein A2U01_0119329, partial [Trifolium medium]|nr:hypothetical protein [Trifolium medium]